MKRNTSRLICTYTTTNFMVLKLFNCFYDNPVTEKEINWFRKRHYCVMSVVYLARVWRAWVAITSCLDHVALQVVLATELLLATCAWIWLQPCKMFKFKSQSCAVWWLVVERMTELVFTCVCVHMSSQGALVRAACLTFWAGVCVSFQVDYTSVSL